MMIGGEQIGGPRLGGINLDGHGMTKSEVFLKTQDFNGKLGTTSEGFHNTTS